MTILLYTATGQLPVAIEPVCSANHNLIFDSWALSAIFMLAKNLLRCPELEMDYLLNTKMAAAMALLTSMHGGINTAIVYHVGGC